MNLEWELAKSPTGSTLCERQIALANADIDGLSAKLSLTKEELQNQEDRASQQHRVRIQDLKVAEEDEEDDEEDEEDEEDDDGDGEDGDGYGDGGEDGDGEVAKAHNGEELVATSEDDRSYSDQGNRDEYLTAQVGSGTNDVTGTSTAYDIDATRAVDESTDDAEEDSEPGKPGFLPEEAPQEGEELDDEGSDELDYGQESTKAAAAEGEEVQPLDPSQEAELRSMMEQEVGILEDLEQQMAEALEGEDYDLCDDINTQMEALKEKINAWRGQLGEDPLE
eukprot:NODE_2345_length_1224_cov_42.794894_g2139_i0.p1 GENE.NODE_2345_length_1224_cov_42.794894_g2139_i0~~NODE_2345_length_1224_cov_42.794894_g2139_i0.p1  ORF type:complete len:316 (+),score=104.56 NODE_2345_length_1224_cov_42.794894_g2139_i0:111-950(+)